MKATGIVRRIDDLGRVVIPKEIRRTLRIREGDPLEIFVDREGEVILKKYSPIGELGDFAQEYADSLHESTGHTTLITDRDTIIAVAGGNRKDWLGRAVTIAVEYAMDNRKTVVLPRPAGEREVRFERTEYSADESEWSFAAQVIAPIIAEGDPIGTVVLGAQDAAQVGELERKLAETAAGFLAKQMEQ
ncbi:MAG TPA: stage V sporulation protein T [Limnochordia bacterium]|nr:stage V sporulation protein T [Limnochordia bacterium]